MSAALLRSRGGLEGWQAKTVDRIRSSAARMGRIIDDLLSYTRTRLGSGIPVEPTETDLAELARRMVDELGAAHAGVRVELRADGDARGEWDGARLEQVISNVVSNAIDHGEEGEPVRVSVSAAGDAVELVVENRGEMPREILDHAFEAFQRGPEQTGRKASGLGLGLYIAREIVQRHSGSILARSREGWTRVVVRLPRRAAAAAIPAPP
jgi:signal transduction histidine kinase